MYLLEALKTLEILIQGIWGGAKAFAQLTSLTKSWTSCLATLPQNLLGLIGKGNSVMEGAGGKGLEEKGHT